METFKVGAVILDKYKVTAVLGKGGMGVVLAALHLKLNELVALKFLHPSLRDKPEIAARFAEEARTATRIKNAHVALIRDVETVDGVPFIVMEHLTGRDLAAMIRERGQLRIDESADLLLQACEAVHEAHALGIVHRDLKPGNLFVTTEPDGTDFVRVLDFGISKSDTDTSMTSSTAILGSPQYMSPEQVMSAKSVDVRSDVWSLGVILYEMLTGKAPFTGDAAPAVYAAIHRGDYRNASELRPEVAPALEQMLSEALKKERDDRLPSVEAFAERLAPFGTDAGRASYDRIRRSASRTRAPSERPMAPVDSKAPAPLAGGGEAATGHVTVTTAGSVASSIARTEPPPRRWRPMTALGVLAAVAGLALAVPRLLKGARETRLDSADAAGVDPARTDAASTAECASGATAECEAACAANRPGSCLELARALDKGTGAPRDPARAASLFQKACDGGELVACNNLAVDYATGDGVGQDAAKAVDLYTRACDGGFAKSCVNLGSMHFDGNGVGKNPELATHFFLRGCEAGAPVGCFNVSIAYRDGRGVPNKDPERAFTFAERACVGGAAEGCVEVELARIAGAGVAKDVRAGLAQLDGMCTRREPVACEELAKLYSSGKGADVVADPLRGQEYWKKACELGSKVGCQADHLLGRRDSSDSNAARANALWQKKCDSGDLATCAMLGESLLTGNGTGVDRATGTALRERACKGGVEWACKKLGEGRTQ